MGKLGSSASGFLWQIDRKRKCYYSSIGNVIAGTARGRYYTSTRTTSTILTVITIFICLLFYVNIRSSSSPSSQIRLVAEEIERLENLKSHHSEEHRDFKGEAVLVRRGASRSSGSGSNSNAHKSRKDIDEEIKLAGTAEDKIRIIFRNADTNRDGFLSSREISKWINDGIKLHFSSALRDNFDSFFRIDTNPRNGRVEWAEYLDFYLKSINYKGPQITPEGLKNKEQFKKLPKHIKVEIAALEARWSESATNDPEFLTVDEFLAFTHPEASPSKMIGAVQDTFNTFDLDGDGVITKTEFDTTYAEAEGVDPVYKEDLHIIDADKNTQIARVELMRYMDPKNMVHSDKEARQLIAQVDADQDGSLSLDELLQRPHVVTPSKLYDVAKNYHTNQLHN